MLSVKTEFWLPSVWLVMTERVAAFRTYFSRRRADTITVGTSLSPNCLRVCGEVHIVLSSCLDCLVQPAIVGSLWGVDYILYRHISSCFIVFVCLRFPSVSFVEFVVWRWDQRHCAPHPFESMVKQLGRYEFNHFVHRRCRASTNVDVVLHRSLLAESTVNLVSHVHGFSLEVV